MRFALPFLKGRHVNTNTVANTYNRYLLKFREMISLLAKHTKLRKLHEIRMLPILADNPATQLQWDWLSATGWTTCLYWGRRGGRGGRSHVCLHDYQPHLQAWEEKEKDEKDSWKKNVSSSCFLITSLLRFPSNRHSRQQQRRKVVATPTSHMTGYWVCQCVRREKMTTGRLAIKLAQVATPTMVRLQRHTFFYL